MSIEDFISVGHTPGTKKDISLQTNAMMTTEMRREVVCCRPQDVTDLVWIQRALDITVLFPSDSYDAAFSASEKKRCRQHK